MHRTSIFDGHECSDENGENGFDLTGHDRRTLQFADDYSRQLLAIDVNIDMTEMLDTAWQLFSTYFLRRGQIRQSLVDTYWHKRPESREKGS